MVVANARQEITRDLELLAGADQGLVRVGDHALDRLGKEPLVPDVEALVDDAAHGSSHRADGSPRMQKVVPQTSDPSSHDVARPVVDVILELVDLSVERDHHIEE